LFIVSLFFKKYRKIDTIIILWFSIYLFISFRNLVTYSYITKTWLSDYSYSDYENKTFFDLWDYLVFTDKVLNFIKKENCSVYVESFQDWPFKSHMSSVYLRACEIVDDISKADYAVYYKKEYSNELKWTVLVNFNSSYLIKINK